MSRSWYVTWGTILIIIGLVLGSPTEAAEPERWAGTPVFYTLYTPQMVDCVYDETSTQGSCRIKGYPEEGIVGVTTVDAPARAQPMRLYTEVTCLKGICQTQYGEAAGEVLGDNTQYWSIPVGYYLVQYGKTVKAIKHGNGPSAKKYPIRGVQLIAGDHKPDGTFVPVENDNLTYNVFCNPGGDCSYMGKVINYAELNKYVSKRMTTQCDERFCYNPNMAIAGLNPRTNS